MSFHVGQVGLIPRVCDFRIAADYMATLKLATLKLASATPFKHPGLGKQLQRWASPIIAIAFLISGAVYASTPSQEALFAKQSTTYYVSRSGSDSRSGKTPELAWQTIAHVNEHAFQPGDKILFLGGQSFFGAITLPSSGTCDAPITIGSYGTGSATIVSDSSNGFTAEAKGGFIVSNLIFTGSGSTANMANGIAIDNNLSGNTKLSCVTVSGVTVSGYGANCIRISGSSGASGFNNLTITQAIAHDCTGSTAKEAGCIVVVAKPDYGLGTIRPAHTNITISHNQAYNCTGKSGGDNWTGSGIVISEVGTALVEYNVAHDNGANSTRSNGPVGIWTYDSTGVTIQFNESYHNLTGGGGGDGGGFDLDGGVVNSVMQYNYAHDNVGAGYQIEAYNDGRVTKWQNNIVRFNISQNNGVGLMVIANSTMTRCLIYNNTIYGNYAFDEQGTASTNCIAANNIFYSLAPSSSYVVNVQRASSIVLKGNDYWQNGKFSWNGTTYGDFAAWQAATGQEKVGGVNSGLVMEPRLFVNGGGGTTGGYAPASLNAYRLQTGSPMLEAGLDLSRLYGIDVGTRDYYGAAVPDGSGKYNIGAGGLGTFTASCSQASTFLARTSGLDTAHKEQYNALICGSIADGTWSSLDALYKLAADNSTNAGLNLVSPNFSLTAHGTIAFTANQGYAGNGSTGYLDTGFVPSTAGGSFALNSASLSAYVMKSRTKSENWCEIGSAGSNAWSSIFPLVNGDIYATMNDGTGVSSTVADAKGLWIASRISSSDESAYKNGHAIVSGSVASVALPTTSVVIGAINSTSDFSTDQIGYAFLGGGLTATQAFYLSNRINADAIALGVNAF
jgi:hypothetical protein